MSNKAVIAGASGLTGGHLLRNLLDAPEYDEVFALVRKELPVTHPKLVQLIINFDLLHSFAHAINGKAVFCCLGTTKAKTPDPKAYQHIERDIPVKLAQIASGNGVSQFHYMSSVGADASSGNTYLKAKGQTEEAISKLSFQAVHVYRPSLLIGDRGEIRLGEKLAGAIMKIVDPLLLGDLKRYQSIPAATVAQAMYKTSLKRDEGVLIHPSHNIKQIA
ncbi:NAD(P)H-binding protein [Mucilaginibacter daejeonensis]|uniref:NAD(P)H-binding protein n=1 Tax=Mucilaginibacter daejeonensis TaxID=398049 RepID=UPI001D1767B1|nr:NAD(P)H-binding protein [Mucilaginibacter daejeonensis]UEG53416.1 NAD(P)H-binding protein [Mucilaginibacter daejeonensis]